MSSNRDCTAEIRKLPHSVSSMTRSCLSITSYATCINELVCNAIDAGATNVAVRVDFNCHRIQVVDNGHGIDKKNLENIAERHMTSKIRSINDLENCLENFGFRGEALASIREITRILKFASKPTSSKVTFEKVFLEGRPGAVTCASKERPSAGTTVTLLDFLHNVPVRRKKISEMNDTEDIKVQLECLALIHPHMSISFKNVATGKMILESRKCGSVKDVFGQLFGPVLSDHLKELTFDIGKGVHVNGYVSTRGHYTKSYQLIYVNRRIVIKTQMHKAVIYMLSWMLRNEKKQKYPIFILNLTCPYAIYDITLDPKKTQIEFKNWSVIVETFEAAMKQFLGQYRLERPPENKKKSDEMMIENRDARNFALNGHSPKLGLWKTVSGAISKRQFSNQNIVKEVLQNSQHDQMENSPPAKQETRNIAVLTKMRNIAKPPCSTSNPSTPMTSRHVQTPPQPMPVRSDRPGWDQKFVRSEMYNQYCSTVLTSVKMFMDADRKRQRNEFPSQPSQPLPISQESDHKSAAFGTTLTQVIGQMGVSSADEPPDEIYQRHATFEFQPIMEPEVVVEECHEDDEYKDDESDIFFDASNGSANMDIENQQFPRSTQKVEERFLQVHDVVENYSRSYDEIATTNSNLNNYCTKSPLTKKKSRLNLPILDHLSPNSSMYRQIIETFASDAITSPTVESPRPHVSSFTPSISSQKYYSPGVELISSENISPSVEEEVEQYEPETYHENEPYEPKYCALELFDDVEDESEENCSVEINLDQKRKQTSPIVAAVSCKKTRMTGEWQQNENELGQEFYVNQRTGQVVANVPIVAEEFLIRERRQFMPFGTSPIMQLAPSCELKMDEDVQQILNRAVEDNFNYSGDVAASLKWQSLDELAKERDKLGILDEMIKTKVLNAGLRPMPVLENTNMFENEAFIKMRQSLLQAEIPSDILNTARVIGQFDKKFMVVLSDHNGNKSNLVILVDQHAAHERVRLEELTKDYQTANQQFLHTPLHLPQNITLTKHQTRMVQEFQGTFQKYGLECEALSETEVRVFSVPVCFMNKHQRQQPKQGWNLEEAVWRLIRELVDDLQETRGVCLTIPKEIRDVLNSEACSGAVKFNMALSKSACTDLLQQLSKCKLPFQCAHGRNSTFSALDLDKIKSKEVQKPRIAAFVEKRKSLFCA